MQVSKVIFLAGVSTTGICFLPVWSAWEASSACGSAVAPGVRRALLAPPTANATTTVTSNAAATLKPRVFTNLCITMRRCLPQIDPVFNAYSPANPRTGHEVIAEAARHEHRGLSHCNHSAWSGVIVSFCPNLFAVYGYFLRGVDCQADPLPGNALHLHPDPARDNDGLALSSRKDKHSTLLSWYALPEGPSRVDGRIQTCLTSHMGIS